MKPKGPCVHPSTSSNNQQIPSIRRKIAEDVCLRLYAEGLEQRQYKELLYSKFGLKKVLARSGIKSTTAISMSRNPETTTTSEATATNSRRSFNNSQHSAFKCGVIPTSRAVEISKKTSVSETSISRAGNTSRSPTKDRRSHTVYVPPGGRSPTATTTQHSFAKTYSLQSTIASRAAVAPRRKVSTRRPSSPTGSAQSAQSSTAQSSRRWPSSTDSPSTDNAKSRKTTSSNVSLGRSSQLVQTSPGNQHQRSTAQQKRMSVTTHTSSEISMRRGTRASMISPQLGAMTERRPSTAPSQPSKRTASIVFQVQPVEPVLVQVSRRTSSLIAMPGSAGGQNRRPSVAPIGPMASLTGGASDICGFGSSPGHATSPRASFLRRDNKLEKLQEQVNVLKASLGISDEDLLWRVESSKGNAFLAADQHLASSEERYDRLVFEMQELSRPDRCTDEDKANVILAAKLRSLEQQALQVAEWKAKAVACQTDMAQTKKILLAARVETELQRAKQNSNATASATQLEQLTSKRLESIKESLLSVQQQLKPGQEELQTLLEWLGTETDRFAASLVAEDKSPSYVISVETVEAKRSLLTTLRAIPECAQGSGKLSTLCTKATQLASKITASRARDLKYTETELERVMRDIEIWKTRREQAKEFADEMGKREAAWQTRQREVNDGSLALMRTFIPADITDLTVEALVARAREGLDGSGSGTLYTYDLATYLKTNRFLHWLITHGDDIERANFLAVESAPFFMDFTSYDIHELQALVRVLPDSFSFDKDGRKRVWRTSFIEHVRMQAAQHQHETIKAGWDPVRRARRDVPLPKLTARQQLNPIFCYPTDAEIDARLDKFERQRSRLESKHSRLKKLDDELIPQAKAEYLAVAEDARNEDMQRTFGKTTLNALRDDAKQQHLSLCKERDTAKRELVHGERAWAAMSPSFEQYQAEVTQIRALDPEIRNAPRIRGPFPANVDLQPRERATFKKLSVEEEAEARKQELDSAIAKRGLDISEVATSEEVTVVESAPPPPPPSPPSAVAANGLAVESTLTASEIEVARLMQLEDKLCANVVAGTLSNLPTNAPTAPPQLGFQRVKSLQVAVGVLSFLEKDFCSPKRVQRGKEGGLVSPSQKQSASLSVKAAESPSGCTNGLAKYPRSSRSTPSTPRGDLKTTQEEETKEAKVTPVSAQPKSKTLLKLLEARRAEEAGTSPISTEPGVGARPSPFGGGKVNFLGELQGRFHRKGSNAEATASGDNSEAESASVGAKKPMNFLDELKRTSVRKAVNSGDPAEVENISQPQVLEMPASSSKSSSTAPPAPRNFLDELKARTANK